MAENHVKFKDFTLKRDPIRFRIADQNFDAVPSLNAGLLQRVAGVAIRRGRAAVWHSRADSVSGLVAVQDDCGQRWNDPVAAGVARDTAVERAASTGADQTLEAFRYNSESVSI